jgi:hypothetical protein
MVTPIVTEIRRHGDVRRVVDILQTQGCGAASGSRAALCTFDPSFRPDAQVTHVRHAVMGSLTPGRAETRECWRS